MSKWRNLQQAADLAVGPQIERDVWSLSEDPRFAAVLAVIKDVQFTRLAGGTNPASASDHGVLAHHMGAVDALDELMRRLEGMVEPPPDTEEKPE